MSIQTALNDIKHTRKHLAEVAKIATAIKRNAKRGVYAAKPELLAEHQAILAETLSVAAGYAYGFGQSLNANDHSVDLDDEDGIPSFDAIAKALTK
jgi:hypothetical protein